MKHRKTWMLAIVMLLLVTVSACPVQAASKKGQIKKVIKTYMAGARQTNAKKMSKCMISPGNFKFTLNQAMQNLPYLREVYKYNTKIIYKINGIKTLGKKARVTVVVKSPDIKKATDHAAVEYMELIIKNPGISDELAEKQFENYLKNDISKYGVQMYIHTMTFDMVKKGGKWKIKASTDADYDLLYGRYLSIMKEYEEASK